MAAEENKLSKPGQIFAGSNFVGGDWENGFGIAFTLQEDNSYQATYAFQEHQQGPPGVAHGGAIAAVIDEAMTAAAFHAANGPALTVNLNVRYLAPIHVQQPVQIVSRIEEVIGRKIFTFVRLTREDGTVVAEANGLFIKVTRTD